MSDQAICWMQGEILPAAQASVSVMDHGLLYGDGVFEGIRFYQNRPFRLVAHLERLVRSARAIALPLPMTLQALTTAVQTTIDAAPWDAGYVRLVVTRGSGALGLDPRSCRDPQVFIIADQLQLLDRQRRHAARLVIASTRRLPADGLDPRIKSLNYLNHILARIEANHAGVDEAILLNAQGRIAEGTADNLFVVRDGRLLTPPVCEGALDGITRALLMDLAVQLGIPCEEIPLTPFDVHTADECLLTGTAAELIAVAEVDGRRMGACPGPVFHALEAAFQNLVMAEPQEAA